MWAAPIMQVWLNKTEEEERGQRLSVWQKMMQKKLRTLSRAAPNL